MGSVRRTVKQAQLKYKEGVHAVWAGVCEEKEKSSHFPLFSQKKKRNPKLSMQSILLDATNTTPVQGRASTQP